MSSHQFPHAMLSEIYEQPESLQRLLDAYTGPDGLRREAFGEGSRAFHHLTTHRDLFIAASGSSRHAGLAGRAALLELAGVRAEVEYSSEYITNAGHSSSLCCCLVLSQSGETADTLEALRKAHSEGASTLAITNQATSTMAQTADISLPLHAGTERAIPATKSFTAQLLMLHLLALALGEANRRLTAEAIRAHVEAARQMPQALESGLQGWQASLEAVLPRLRDVETVLFLGRGPHVAIAAEGALKLKESAYLQAQGYPAGELKHGPNALVSQEVMLVVLATQDHTDPGSVLRYTKTLQLLRDLRIQGARVLAIATDGDREVPALCEACVSVPSMPELLTPILEVVPLQLLAYLLAVERGIDVDSPRNLVKAVTRE